MRLPPGPDTPALLQIARYRFQSFEFLDECANRFGDLFTLRFPIMGPMVCASHPDTIRHIFAASSDELRLGEANAIFRPIFGERSITVLDGPDHVRLRRLSLPMFHDEHSQAWTGMMLEVAARRVSRWRAGQHLRLREEMQALTLEVILRALLGLEEQAELEEVGRHAMTMVHWPSSPFGALLMVPALRRNAGPLTPWRGFKRDFAALEALVMAQVALRRRAGDAAQREDVLSRLLTVREGGAHLSDGELRDLLLMLLFAGFETTATALCWAFEAVLSHPADREWLEEELRTVTAGGPLRAEHMGQLVRVEAAVREVLRLYPVVPIIGMARLAVRPFVVQGVELPAGAKIVPTSYLTQRRADVYPEPHRFRPARFLGIKPDPVAWLPFGGGLRRCVGLPFALHELRVVLAYVLGQVRLRLAWPTPPRAALEGVTVGPAGGTAVIVEHVGRA
jgi:cytochrome P450